MTGWRIGMAVGNPRIIDALMRVKSNIDSGVAQAVQRMAIAGARWAQDCIPEHNGSTSGGATGRSMRSQARAARHAAEGEPLIWAKVPEGMTSAGFAERLLDEAAVIVTPGTGYGSSGEGYVRLSLTLADDRLEEGLRRIAALPALA